jgi:hypothetical protein
MEINLQEDSYFFKLGIHVLKATPHLVFRYMDIYPTHSTELSGNFKVIGDKLKTKSKYFIMCKLKKISQTCP